MLALGDLLHNSSKDSDDFCYPKPTHGVQNAKQICRSKFIVAPFNVFLMSQK